MTQAREAIHRYAKENGKTCDDIANELGIGRASFFNKMRGQYSFTMTEAHTLSRMLGITMDDFYAMTQA